MAKRRPRLHPGEPMAYVPTPVEITRFLSKVEVDTSTPRVRRSHCWRWTAGADAKGYGQVWLAGKARWAHRVAYELFHAPRSLRHGMDVDHVCNNAACVCPRHLRATTRSLNSARGGRRRHAVDDIPF